MGVPPNHHFLDFSIANHPAIGVPPFIETLKPYNNYILTNH